ncbi:hypothetical protein [Desulfatirhabdium butyrativorans]|uniref:hypothetical protein n=1 Tax=Desulfatirhabdium butyrativorans TaxID=340467 RepID=UPI0012EC4302|nr:hypothetical protein [Desulfatirhabdium butyrativorans]
MFPPKGWFFLQPPKYRIPSVFDLHERGLFTTMPSVTRKSGACLVVKEDLQVSIWFKYITEGHTVRENVSYSYRVNEGILPLKADMTLDDQALADIVESDAREEVLRIHAEWYRSYIPMRADNIPDRPELEKKLASSLNEGKKLYREELKRQNNRWIERLLGVKIWKYKKYIHPLVSDELFSDYRKQGGEDTEEGLIRKVQLFSLVYDTDQQDDLLKPDGNHWGSEGEMWDCWIAYAGSELEAKRVCQSMEAVFRPLSASLSN